jgi:ribosomal protein L29
MPKSKELSSMTDEELAELRADYDAQMAVLREKKAAIQAELDSRYVLHTPQPGEHVIGG